MIKVHGLYRGLPGPEINPPMPAPGCPGVCAATGGQATLGFSAEPGAGDGASFPAGLTVQEAQCVYTGTSQSSENGTKR